MEYKFIFILFFQLAARLQVDNKPTPTTKPNVRSPKKQRSRRAGISHLRLTGTTSSASRHSSSKSTDESDEDNEDAPLMTSKEQPHHSRRIVTKPVPVAASVKEPRAFLTDNINKGVSSGSGGLTAAEHHSNQASPLGSSSSLDSPLDTTDNDEVYKTVIPQESNRRENSLALMLNRAISEAVENTTSSDTQKNTSNLQPPPPPSSGNVE